MKYIPVSTISGTYKATRVDKLLEAFPADFGTYTQVGGGYFPVWEGNEKKLKKCRAPFVWEKALFFMHDGSYPTTSFIPEKDAAVALKYGEMLEWNCETLTQTKLFSVRGSCRGFIWDSENQRFILIGDTIYASSHFTAPIATCNYDGSDYTERGEFTIDFHKTDLDYYSNACFALHNKKIYISYGSNNYNSAPYTHGMTVIDTTTWTEKKIGELVVKPRLVKCDHDNNIVLVSGAYSFGIVDTTTDEFFSAPSMKNGEAQNWPCLQDVGFQMGDYVKQATTFYYRDADNKTNYKCLIEADKNSAQNDLQYKHWVFDLDIEKLKSDPYNCLSNPRTYVNNNPNMGHYKTGKLVTVVTNDNLREMTCFCFSSGQGGSSSVFFGVSLDGGEHINHPFGASRTRDDHESWVNTYGYWQDVMYRKGEIFFTGQQGLAKITPILANDEDLMCGWHEDPTPEPVSISRDRFSQFWFGGDA